MKKERAPLSISNQEKEHPTQPKAQPNSLQEHLLQKLLLWVPISIAILVVMYSVFSLPLPEIYLILALGSLFVPIIWYISSFGALIVSQYGSMYTHGTGAINDMIDAKVRGNRWSNQLVLPIIGVVFAIIWYMAYLLS